MSTTPGSHNTAIAARLQLAVALLATEEHAEALEQFAAVLALEPANVDALRGAARAAEGIGDERRLAGYRQLLLH